MKKKEIELIVAIILNKEKKNLILNKKIREHTHTHTYVYIHIYL
jgi:hypothetical protein